MYAVITVQLVYERKTYYVKIELMEIYSFFFNLVFEVVCLGPIQIPSFLFGLFRISYKLCISDA